MPHNSIGNIDWPALPGKIIDRHKRDIHKAGKFDHHREYYADATPIIKWGSRDTLCSYGGRDLAYPVRSMLPDDTGRAFEGDDADMKCS